MPAQLPKKPSARYDPLKKSANEKWNAFYKKRSKGKKSTKQFEEERQAILKALEKKALGVQRSDKKGVTGQARVIIERAERRAKAESLRDVDQEELEDAEDLDEEMKDEEETKQKEREKAEKEEVALRKDIDYENKIRKRNHDLEMARLDKVEQVLKQMVSEEKEMERQEKAQRQIEQDAELDAILEEQHQKAIEEKQKLIDAEKEYLEVLRKAKEDAELKDRQAKQDILKVKGIGTQNVEAIGQQREKEIQEREEAPKKQRLKENREPFVFDQQAEAEAASQAEKPPKDITLSHEQIRQGIEEIEQARTSEEAANMKSQDVNIPPVRPRHGREEEHRDVLNAIERKSNYVTVLGKVEDEDIVELRQGLFAKQEREYDEREERGEEHPPEGATPYNERDVQDDDDIPTANVANTPSIKVEPTEEGEEMPDVSQGLSTAATTNGSSESLVKGEAPTGGPDVTPVGGQGSSTSAPASSGSTSNNSLEHKPGDTSQEEFAIASNSQPPIPDKPGVPVANSSEINEQFQEYAQPMDTSEGEQTEEEKQKAAEELLAKTNAEAAKKQQEIAADPNLAAARKTVEKGMDGVEFYTMTYFGGQDIFGEQPEEKMPLAKKLPVEKLPPAEGKMETDEKERAAAEKESNKPKKMEIDYKATKPAPDVTGQKGLIPPEEEDAEMKKQRLVNEEYESDLAERKQAAGNMLEPKRGMKRIIYYDPTDSTVYITLRAPHQPEVTRNPFEEKPEFEQTFNKEQAEQRAKQRVGVNRVAHQKDIAMQDLEFFTRGTAGTEYERQNLKQVIGQRNQYWKQRQKQIAEYEKSTFAQKDAIIAQWRKNDKEQLDKEAKQNKAMRTRREIFELNEYMLTQFDKLQADFTLENANKKFLYPSLIDKNSRNVIEFARDAKGDLLRDPVTGGPIISTTWAVERDDAERLRQQKAVADGMIQKKPYFPIFGKAAKKFFSKAEYCQLARMMGNDGNPYPETVMRTEKTIDRKLDKLYKKLQKTMNLPPLPQDESRKKILVELQTLEQAFAQYSTSALYDYPNTLDQADKDNDQTEEFESAVQTLEKITMGKLLQQLAARKADEIKDKIDREENEKGYEEGRQMNAQDRFPTFGHNKPGQTATYTGVGRGPNIANPAEPPPDEEAVSRLSNFVSHKPDDNGEAQQQAESRFQYADPIRGLDLDVSAPSSGIPGQGLQLPAAPENMSRISAPSEMDRRNVNPMGRGGWGGRRIGAVEETKEDEFGFQGFE